VEFHNKLVNVENIKQDRSQKKIMTEAMSMVKFLQCFTSSLQKETAEKNQND